MLDSGEPQAAVAKLLGVDQSTVSRLAARSEGKHAKVVQMKIAIFAPFELPDCPGCQTIAAKLLVTTAAGNLVRKVRRECGQEVVWTVPPALWCLVCLQKMGH
jgi:hypothetical protein